MFGLFSNVTDPVCRMKVSKKEAKFFLENDNGKYYFCSENCKGKFTASPEKYIQATAGSCCH